MALSTELINAFVKATNDKTETKHEATVYGTVFITDGVRYVKLDGTDELTPVSSLVTIADGDRVKVTIKDHRATVTGNVTSISASANSVMELSVQAATINADKVTTTDLDAVVARVKILETDSATVKNLEAAEARIDEIDANVVTINKSLTAQDATIKSLDTEKLDVDTARATYATIENLEATDAKVYNLEGTYGDFQALTANKFAAMNASIDELAAKKLNADTANITYAKITDLDAVEADVESLDANVANIDTLIFGSASGSTIQTSFANAVIAQLGNAQIKSAMIDNIAASKIASGEIITDKVHVKSQNGLLLISDETIQISDDNRVRVQIGKDASNDYSINIWDADGNLMFSKGGITDSAIKDAIIRNDMVSDTANIAAHKLDIDSLFEEINGSTNTIKSTQIHLDDKNQTLDVAFKELSTEITDLGESITSQGTQMSAIQGQISSKVWQQDINTAKGEMNSQYSTLEQEIDSISATIASHTTQIGTKADSSNVTTVNDRVSTLASTLAGFQSTVSSTYATKTALATTDAKATTANTNALAAQNAAANAQADVDNLGSDVAKLESRVSTAETDISQNTEAITLRATKTELNSAKAEAISTASSDATTKANNALSSANANTTNLLKSYSTTSQMNSAIELKANSITSSVSETYATKTALATTDAKATTVQANLNKLDVGGRNLVLDSSVILFNGSDNGNRTCSVIEDDYVKVTPVTNGNVYHSTGIRTSVPRRKGVEYTFSFEILTPTNIGFYWYPNEHYSKTNYISASDSWQKVKFTYTQTGEDSSNATLFGLNDLIAGETYYCRNVKLETGNMATAWSPAPEDLQNEVSTLESRVTSAESQIVQNKNAIELRATSTEVTTAKQAAIDSANSNTANLLKSYSTTSEMEAAIKVKSDSIVSSVSSTYATKTALETTNTNVAAAQSDIDNLEIGARNLFGGFGDEEVQLYDYNSVGSFRQFSNLTIDASEYVGRQFTVSFWAKSPNGETSIQAYNRNGNPRYFYFQSDFKEKLSTEWKYYHLTFTNTDRGESVTGIHNRVEIYAPEKMGVLVKKIKVEMGNRPTDWTPAPEYMATAKDNDLVKSAAEAAQETASTAETLIRQLTDNISMLVTDGNGTSLMTQTEDGWTFSTASIQTSVASAAETLSSLTEELGDTNNVIDVIRQAVDDLGEIAEYVKIGSYENEPCIELGDSDSEFKMRITNTRILFMEGSNVVAHISNQSLHIKKAVIEEELQQGDFVWQIRSNGNLGLIWKG